MKTSMLVFVGLIGAMNSEATGQSPDRHSAATSTSAVSGQTPARTELADCDYNACALRMKLSWGKQLIVRGEQGKRVANLGMFGTPNIEALVATSSDAVVEARRFQRNYMAGQLLPVVGAGIMVASLLSGTGDDPAAVAGVAGGIAVTFYGLLRSNRAINALHKTIWLYNRALQR